MKTYASLSAKSSIKLVAKISLLGVSLVAIIYFFVWTLLSALKAVAELIS